MSEQLKILEMIENGQISAAEGLELIEALKASEVPLAQEQGASLSSAAKPKYKFLKVKVTSITRL